MHLPDFDSSDLAVKNNDIDPKGNHHMKIIERVVILAAATTTFATAFCSSVANVPKVFRVMYVSIIAIISVELPCSPLRRCTSWSRRYSFFSDMQPLTCESSTSTTYWHLHL